MYTSFRRVRKGLFGLRPNSLCSFASPRWIVAIFAPLVDAGGAFFCLEVFPIFIKFYGGAVFLYSIVIPDFFKN